MEDEEDVSLHLPHDALSQASQSHDFATLCRAERRVDRAQQRGADHTGTLERLADDTRGQCLEVNRDVGELRHGPGMLSTETPGAPPPHDRTARSPAHLAPSP